MPQLQAGDVIRVMAHFTNPSKPKFMICMTLLHGSVVRRQGLDGVSGPRFSPWAATVPFKANQDRRHHIPKQRHRVTNWAAYDVALRQRGSLTVVHGSGDCGVEGRAPRHARRPTALLGVGDHHGADAAGGFPPGATPDRRADRIPASAAWS